MKQKFFDHEEQRYSIRKYAFGAASVLIGSVLFMAGPVAKAEDITTSSDSSTIATQVVNTDETSSTTAEETSPVATMNTAQSTSEAVVASTTATTSESTVESTTSEVVTSETATSELYTETVTSEMASADVTSNVVSQSVTMTAQTASSEVSSNETTTTSEVAAYTTREVSETSDVIVVDPQIEKVTGAVTTSTNGAKDIPSSGRYTYTERTEVKNTPSVSANVAFYANAGDSVNYDKVLTNDGRQWISYTSYSGTRRYANVGAVNTNAPVTTKKVEAKQTGTINIENKTSNGFDVVVTNVSSTTPIAEVKVPVWSTQGDQDDITWNTATKQSDGSYKTSVKVSDHKSNYGDYNIHLYYALTDGKFVGVAATKTTVEAPKTDVRTGNISVENKTSQGFDVVISNVSAVSGVQKVVVPIWSTQGGQDDIIWYDATNQNNGTYKVNVKVSDHKNNYGEYNIHLYYTQNDGKFEGVAATTTTLEQPKEAQKASISYNGSYYHVQGKYDDILIVNKKYPLSSNYNPGENSTAKEAFVRMRNDMINQGYNVGYAYSGFRSYNTQSGLYQSYVNRDGQEAADRYSARPGYSEHQTGLSYDLTDKSGNLLEDAAASNWLKNNAHNYGFIVRYQPGKEASTGFMEEAWHVRYIGKEAKEIHDSGLSLEEYFGIQGGGYSSSSTGIPTTTIPSIPSQGRYTFTKRSSIKSEPKKSSAELAYYDAGQSVNYDKVLDSDGARWISYVAYSGARRYIAIS
ncbi:GBS Bsp-like repeat-containing protein [Streptococcus sp. HF-1907]|uniref:LD-carboxypeptidase LdcB/DacB n=1 Tax=Streptococcus sp. HF-1907 TaxID=2785793 RepID=UPI00189FEDE2|nr:LD-carboxypeptidase LdcB/DacB [Streptococcus sp. HF-1907]MBF7094090.1 GBS Bsp-like repeat-containing protein [Streptococcus sp. HF-1907]